MNTNHNYKNVTEALSDLHDRGYTTDFKILAEKDSLYGEKDSTQLSPEEYHIDETYHLKDEEGSEKIIFAISSTEHNLKGFVVNKDGANCAYTMKMVKHLVG